MAPLAAVSNSRSGNTGQILDAIEVQFKLDDVSLTRITTQFLQEIANGLAEYGQAMAIMYVRSCRCLRIHQFTPHCVIYLVQLSSPAFHRARRRGQ